jgi:hypothetical protein
VREAILVKELERGHHSSDGQDLSEELDKDHALAFPSAPSSSSEPQVDHEVMKLLIMP